MTIAIGAPTTPIMLNVQPYSRVVLCQTSASLKHWRSRYAKGRLGQYSLRDGTTVRTIGAFQKTKTKTEIARNDQCLAAG